MSLVSNYVALIGYGIMRVAGCIACGPFAVSCWWHLGQTEIYLFPSASSSRLSVCFEVARPLPVVQPLNQFDQVAARYPVRSGPDPPRLPDAGPVDARGPGSDAH